MNSKRKKCEIPKTVCNLRDEDGYCLLGNGYECQPVVDKCEGCEKIENGYCKVYIFPKAKWRFGNCPMATHLKKELTKEERIRVGQQKQRRAR